MRVAVYKNLNLTKSRKRTIWSVGSPSATGQSLQHKGISHHEAIALRNCVLIVNRAGYNRVCAQNSREVHAWIIGEPCEIPKAGTLTEVSYNYKRRAPWFATRDGTVIEHCDDVRKLIEEKK